MNIITPEPLKVIQTFYIDPNSNWDTNGFHKANRMRGDLLDICAPPEPSGFRYNEEITEVVFKTRSLSARNQYRVGLVLKKYLNLDMQYWIDTPASLTRTGNQIVSKTYEFPRCLCSKELTPFDDGFDVYPYEIRFRLDCIDYSIRMGIKKEE